MGGKKLTFKQKKFADKYLETGNGGKSAKEVYDVKTDSVARSIASENLTKPNVREYLESKAEVAASIIFDLAKNSQNDAVRLNASKDIMDRSGYKAVDRSEVRMNVESEVDNIDVDALAYEISKKLKEAKTQ